MAKISEMSKEQIEKYITVYQQKIDGGDDVATNQKKMNALVAGLNKLVPESETVSQEVETFHSSEIDYSSFEDAKFGQRALALFIDSVILMIGFGVLNAGLAMVLTIALPNQAAIILIFAPILINSIGTYVYAYFLLKDGGQTLGKKIMKIKVIYTDSKDELNGKTIFIREVFGKFVSGLVLGLGYLFVLFGKEAWHDSFAKTKVIKVK